MTGVADVGSGGPLQAAGGLNRVELVSLPKALLLEMGLSEDQATAIKRMNVYNEIDVRPLVDASMPWREWVPTRLLRRDCAPFGPFHVRLWDWFDNLVLDQKSLSAVVPWSRGLGKSTCLEGGIVRTCVTGSRRFWLYVSRTLDDANNHVMTIARILESMGIERAVNKYNLAIGWSAQRLRTANGFSILSFGLDAGARGVKLDDVRPDGIALDDIDHLGESMEMVEKKCRIIANTIMQCGSPSFAAIFVQNLIGQNTVMSRILDGRLAVMADRDPELARVIPAIYDLAYESYFTDDGRELARITGGRSSWEGKTLADWQYQIDKGTLDGFLVECQHLIHIGATFFDSYSPQDHHLPAEHTPRGIPGPDTPTWYFYFAGFDWGYSDLSAFVLCACDENGAVHVLESWEINRLSNDDLAAKIIKTLDEWGVAVGACQIYSDGTMWYEKTFNGIKAPADVEAFFKAGLKMVHCAVGSRANRFRNSAIRAYLKAAEKFRMYRGYNHRLNECLKNAQPDRNDAEQVLHNIYSHLVLALGHAMSSRPKPSTAPEEPLTPDEEVIKRREMKEASAIAAKEQQLRDRNKRAGIVPKLDAEGEEMRTEDGKLMWMTEPPK